MPINTATFNGRKNFARMICGNGKVVAAAVMGVVVAAVIATGTDSSAAPFPSAAAWLLLAANKLRAVKRIAAVLLPRLPKRSAFYTEAQSY